MKRILLCLLLLLLLPGICCQCKKAPSESFPERDAFERQTVLGVYRDGSTPIFAFDEAVHQLAVSTSSFTSRIQTDDMSSYIHLAFSESPDAGKTLTTALKKQGISGLTEGVHELTVLKQQGGMIWVWEEEERIGFLLPY
ncbi:MAG: hypothetical protein LBM20_05365 [Rikenellaceae bacterium]|jgi:hypothetical protein|nr:hypothetical protein [Rikenellaceae bacterium]